METTNLKEKVKSLPQLPGVYLYKDASGVVIYVGKAKNLKRRVGSYFSHKLDSTTKTYKLVKSINSIDYIIVESEFEALILEAELIKKYNPKYNIQLKDDKSYLYIVIRDKNLPIVTTARKSSIKKGDIYFGPYPNGKTAKYLLKVIRKIFPFRDCSKTKFNKYQKLKSPCLYGHIGVCPAPCVNEDSKKYKKNIRDIKKLLSGKTHKVLLDLEKQMKRYSKNQEYENAARIRDLLEKFTYIRQNFRDAEEYIDNPYLVDDIAKTALKELKNNLPFVKKLPKRIECYDISNISGKDAVGSMVVATNGKIDKSEYKNFKIKFKDTPDDFDMMYEVLYRRLNYVGKNKSNWPDPDLIVLDGGKGQVSAVIEAMKEYNLKVPLMGIAKKFETLVYKDEDKFKEISLSKENPGLKLIIALRDESHRFAQSYHHKLRLRSIKGYNK